MYRNDPAPPGPVSSCRTAARRLLLANVGVGLPVQAARLLSGAIIGVPIATAARIIFDPRACASDRS
jgi:hypothetical protein